MLPVIRAAAFRIESRARCAYRAVVYTCVWQSSSLIIVRLLPSANARGGTDGRCLRTSDPRWGKDDGNGAMGKGTIPPKERQTAKITPF